MKTTIKAILAGLTLSAACIQPSLAQLSGYGVIGGMGNGGSDRVEFSSPEYTCYQTMGKFYADLSTVYSAKIDKNGDYYGTTAELAYATQASKRLQRKYNEAKQVCKASFLPANVVNDFLRGFNFITGDFDRK